MIKLIEFNGCKMFCNDSLFVHRMYMENGLNYEIHVRKELERLLPKAEVFWDIGANAGLHTVSAKQINPNLKVVCFEPSPPNYEMLVRTIGVNAWKDVFLVPVAVGGRCGLEGINECPDNPVIGEHGANFPKFIQMLTLDTFDLPLPNVVKIDIEGCELDALRCATKLMSARPAFLSEYNMELLGKRGQLEEYPDFFLERGYRVTCLDFQEGMRMVVSSGADLLSHVRNTSGSNTDILCEPL